MDKAYINRFMEKVEIITESGCWIWTGGLARGYGRFWLNGKGELAHRVAYIAENGEIPEEGTKCLLIR